MTVDQELQRQKISDWKELEAEIRYEMQWLCNVIPTFFKEEKHLPITCNECILREVATLVVSGHVKAREINRAPSLLSFWLEGNINTSADVIRISHGKEWHSLTMEKIEAHFLAQGCKVVREPDLYWGRADLGIYKHSTPDLFVEVGTISMFKLLVNLKKMRNSILLLVPSDDRLIEFRSVTNSDTDSEQGSFL